MDKTQKKRFFEVDLLRGIAIVMMVLFHIFFDLDYFGIAQFDMHSGPMLVMGRSSATMFIFLVGVSLTLSYSRSQLSSPAKQNMFFKFAKRGAGVFSWGLLITLITATVLEEGTVYFGILHLIGVSIILSYPFLKYRAEALVTGFIVILLGIVVTEIVIESPLLLWLGIMPYGFYTLDYFPLFPWFGVVLLGIFTGNSLYVDYQRQFAIFDFSENLAVRSLGYLGRRSLFIYLVHQPIIVGVLLLFSSLN
ncbi:heparan-alpha-glucosaminide N-acetyltransferase [Methanolobus sp. ZRKC3]|uniref:heparan-alpha-glucosaminide N-acetyltransferase n=1 Tax=Methanolobus sp. ZRKC3 TaxID=3125786 RepID=UPI003255F0DD